MEWAIARQDFQPQDAGKEKGRDVRQRGRKQHGQYRIKVVKLPVKNSLIKIGQYNTSCKSSKPKLLALVL